MKYPSVIRLVENMMSLDPQQRFQTPSQLLEAVREIRRELQAADKPQGRAAMPSTIFIAEKDEHLQDLFREKFKAKGLRVLLASDPARALDRFRQQPFDLLVVDAGTTGESGLFVFERILNDARSGNLPCSGVLILAEDQVHWQEKISQRHQPDHHGAAGQVQATLRQDPGTAGRAGFAVVVPSKHLLLANGEHLQAA